MGIFVVICLIFKLFVIISAVESNDCIWNYKCCISEIDDNGFKKCLIMCPPVVNCEPPQIIMQFSIAHRLIEKNCRPGYRKNSVGQCVKVY